MTPSLVRKAGHPGGTVSALVEGEPGQALKFGPTDIAGGPGAGPGPEPGGRSAGRAKGSGRRLGRFMIWRAVYAFLHFEAKAKRPRHRRSRR